MADYKSMYFYLMEKVADAIDILQEAQLSMEEKYISSENSDINFSAINFSEEDL